MWTTVVDHKQAEIWTRYALQRVFKAYARLRMVGTAVT